MRLTIPLLVILAFIRTAGAAGPPTPQEIAHMNAQVQSARKYFEAAWQDFFRRAGAAYISPKVVPYSGSVNTGCGPSGSNNAGFCTHDNTIYYDQVFLAAEMKAVGEITHTDGDYAAIVILAHEWGHAAQYWYTLKVPPRYPQPTLYIEQTADCLAGAITKAAERDGRLEPGDLKEGEQELEMSGDIDFSKYLPVPDRPKPETVHDVIKDTLNKLRGHGPPAQRLAAFRRGYQGSVAACVPEARR